MSASIQSAGSNLMQALQQGRRQQGVFSQEAVLSDADLYRQYAKEAMHGSSKVKDENEKQALIDLACTWAQAALMSERVLGASFISSPHDVVKRQL